jgi:hypothetical protein
MIRPLMIVSGTVEALFGLFLLITPNLVAGQFLEGGASSDEMFLARGFGSALLALGGAALLARNHLNTPGGLPIVYGLTAYNLLGAVILAWAAATGLGGAMMLSAAVYHALMGAALVYAINAELGPWLKQG